MALAYVFVPLGFTPHQLAFASAGSGWVIELNRSKYPLDGFSWSKSEWPPR